MRCCSWLIALALVVIQIAPLGGDDAFDTNSDEQMLKNAKVGVDGPGLLAYLRQSAPNKKEQAKIEECIQQLHDPETREQATAELLRLGAPSVPFLRRASRSSDASQAQIARDCLKLLDKDPEDGVPFAVVRLLTERKPAGATQALLDYLPLIADEELATAARVALAANGVRDGEAALVLLEALHDKNPVLRASVAEILGEATGTRHLADLKHLSSDKDPEVRRRVAQVLVGLRDGEAIPLLIASIVDRRTNARATHDLLLDLGGAKRQSIGPDAPSSPEKCRDAWLRWWKELDDQALLESFRKGTLTETQANEFRTLIRRLGDDDFEIREKASRELTERGDAAVSLLLRAAKEADVEVVRRAEACLEAIQKRANRANPAKDCRLVALRKPATAMQVLLDYVPFARDEHSLEEIQAALNVLSQHAAKPDPNLVRALADTNEDRCSAAAVALCQIEAGRRLPEVRALLADERLLVRLHVALALGKHKDKTAFPILIGALDVLPSERLRTTEELLRQLAADQAPNVPLGTDAASRRKCREAWLAWWNTQRTALDWSRLDRAANILGYTLVVAPQVGTIFELGADGKPRWELKGLRYPTDAQLLPGGRILIAEFQGGRVTLRNLLNEILWEKQVQQPVACRRLANGNTFIATRGQMLEVDHSGKEVSKIDRPARDVLAAHKCRNGDIVCLSNTQKLIRFDREGKELKSFAIGPVYNYVQFDVLPNGGYLIPQQGTNKIVEYNADGKKTWEADVPNPYSAQRLANGRTLVSSLNNNRLVELDSTGKPSWEMATPSSPWRAWRR